MAKKKKTKSPFKVGDWVIAKPNNGYGVTTNGWIGEVIEIEEEDESFRAEGRDRFPKSSYWGLSFDSFDLYKAKEPVEPPASTSGWYDPAYLDDGCVKRKIESVEDALTILSCKATCGGLDCDICPCKMFNDECVDARDEALGYLKTHSSDETILLGTFLNDSIDHFKGRFCGCNEDAFNSFHEMCKRISSTLSAKEPTKESVEHHPTCKGCARLTEIGGVPFCTAWHNWTVEDGYCYLHSDKLEDVESVENCVDKLV